MVPSLYPGLVLGTPSPMGLAGMGVTHPVGYSNSQLDLFPHSIPVAPIDPFCQGNLLGHGLVYGNQLHGHSLGLYGGPMVPAANGRSPNTMMLFFSHAY